MDIMSTSDNGPDEGTINALVNALEELGNQEITGLVKSDKDGTGWWEESNADGKCFWR
jgi:hypothetical protein